MSEVRMVTTVEEVKSLPVKTLIDENVEGYSGFHLWRMVNGWVSVGGVPFPDDQVHLPARVLYTPVVVESDSEDIEGYHA